jgi:NitT/TauT family transport system substrate-binding protein
MRRLPGLILLLVGLTGCGGGQSKPSPTAAGVIRVGYFPNLTHAQALVGLSRGDFATALGPGVKIETTVFNAGPSVIEALFAKRIDLAYVGPNPAINGYVQSQGKALRIVAGAMSGGASLVVRNDAAITSPADLDGKRIASPQLGNTQDVALRAFLAKHGLKPRENGGTVEIIPTPNAQIIDLIRTRQLDGAWLPEPWASRLIVEGGCRVLVDERDLWPNGDFVTAQIIVRTEYLEAHPEVVRAWLNAHVLVTVWVAGHPEEAKQIVNAEIKKLTGTLVSKQVLDAAWSRMRPTYDPIEPSLIQCANAAYAAGFLRDRPDLNGIYDLSLLRDVIDHVRDGRHTMAPPTN